MTTYLPTALNFKSYAGLTGDCEILFDVVQVLVLFGSSVCESIGRGCRGSVRKGLSLVHGGNDQHRQEHPLLISGCGPASENVRGFNGVRGRGCLSEDSCRRSRRVSISYCPEQRYEDLTGILKFFSI